MAVPPGDFDAFCRAEWPRIQRALHLMVGDGGLADELAQETMVRVSARWSKVRTLESPGGWAHRVALNLARSSWRRRRAAQQARRRMELLRPDGPGPPHPDDAAIDGIAVQSALAALPRREREVLALRFAADLSVPQVAAVLGCPEGTVKTIARRGLERLREDPAIGALRPPAEPQEGLDVR